MLRAFVLFFSLLFFSSSVYAAPPPQPSLKKELLEAPFHVISFSSRLWTGLFRHILGKKRQSPSARLRLKKNLDNLERVLALANKHYLTLFETKLPSEASPWVAPLKKRHDAINELLGEMKELVLQAEKPSAEQKKALQDLAAPLKAPQKAPPALEKKQEQLLLEAIEIFSTSNEIFGYYHAKQLASCPAWALNEAGSITKAFHQHQAFLKALLKKTGHKPLGLFWYHSALLDRAVTMGLLSCQEKDPKKKALFQKKRDAYLQRAYKSLSQQTKSFSTLWAL
ncbi:MAG: hypothetical protein H6727_10525 [Myxococcales bacterium]|nr:hypothetical protein [Myxococcales bacterium]